MNRNSVARQCADWIKYGIDANTDDAMGMASIDQKRAEFLLSSDLSNSI